MPSTTFVSGVIISAAWLNEVNTETFLTPSQRTSRLGLAVNAHAIGAAGNGLADDTETLQAALTALGAAGGGTLCLAPDSTYRVTSTLTVPTGCGIVGYPTSVIYAPAASFSNTVSADRYASDAVVINASGGLSGAYTPTQRIHLSGFTIQSEVSGARRVRAVVIRNSLNPVVEGLNIYGFPEGVGICLASVVAGRVQNNYIHDFATNTDWGGDGCQITGIEVDNDLVNSVPSSNLVISGNIIKDLTVGATALAAHGYQTDGINIANRLATGLVIANNTISGVGEGIDHFGCCSSIIGNSIADAYIIGIKLVHGASRNTISGGSIENPGLAGIGIYGSTVSGVGNTAYNTITGVTISNLNADQVWNANSNACILIADNSGTTQLPVGNLVTGCVLHEGTYGVYGWLDSSTGSSNIGEGLHIIAGAANSRRVLVTAAAGSCRIAGSGTYSTDLT